MTGPVLIRQASAMDDPRALLVRHNNMHPEIAVHNVVFLATEGFRGEGYYSRPYIDGRHHGDLRSIVGHHDGCSVSGFSKHTSGGGRIIPVSTLERMGLCQVVGIARALTPKFEAYLRARFHTVVS